MAGVLEYLTAEVVELAGNAAKENKRQRIIPRHIMLAIKNDAELGELIGGAVISNGGVIPYIHQILMPKSTYKKPAEVSTEESSENF